MKKECVFIYNALVRINGGKINAFIGIDTFNENKKVIQWYRYMNQVDEKNKWILVENRFTVDDNIKYIRIRLSGNGIGKFRFDNISLKKETVTGN